MIKKTVHVHLVSGEVATHLNVTDVEYLDRVVQIVTDPSDTKRETYIIPLKQIHALVLMEEFT